METSANFELKIPQKWSEKTSQNESAMWNGKSIWIRSAEIRKVQRKDNVLIWLLNNMQMQADDAGPIWCGILDDSGRSAVLYQGPGMQTYLKQTKTKVRTRKNSTAQGRAQVDIPAENSAIDPFWKQRLTRTCLNRHECLFTPQRKLQDHFHGRLKPRIIINHSLMS